MDEGSFQESSSQEGRTGLRAAAYRGEGGMNQGNNPLQLSYFEEKGDPRPAREHSAWGGNLGEGGTLRVLNKNRRKLYALASY